MIQVLHPQYPLRNSSDQDGERNYLWRAIENTNGRNIQREFGKQQKNLLNRISGNCDITMPEMKKFQYDINDFKACLEHPDTVVEEKVANAEKKVEKLQRKIIELWDYQVDPERPELTVKKVVDLEDRS